MNPDLDTLAAALYVRIDDLLAQNPGWAPRRPVAGFAPKLSDAELVTLAVISALLGYDNGSQFVRYAHAHLRPWFPYLANRDGYNKRLRRSGEMIARVMGWLARECESWHDDVWLVDFDAGRVRPKPRHPKALRPRGLGPIRLVRVAFPLVLGPAPASCRHTGGAADRVRGRRRESRRTRGLRRHDRRGPHRPAGPDPHRRQPLCRSAAFEADLDDAGITLLRPATRSEAPRPGARLLRPLRQITESIIHTLKGPLTLERHKARTKAGIAARIGTRLLALTAAFWHNETYRHTRPARSLTAYDH